MHQMIIKIAGMMFWGVPYEKVRDACHLALGTNQGFCSDLIKAFKTKHQS